jgi:hypothetical protein
MATYFLINTVTFAGGKLLPGVTLDSVVDAFSYGQATASGALLVPTTDPTVAAAAAKAVAAHAKGANEVELEEIMMVGLNASLASTATGSGASAIGIEDAGSLFTATTVEAALAEVKAEADAAIALQKRTVTVTDVTLTDAVAGEAQVVAIGAALPANAIVLAHEVLVTTLFSGGSVSAVKLDIGGTVAAAIVSQMDVFTGAATGSLSPRTGAHAQGKFSAQQLNATFTPDGGHTLAALTAGSVTITVWFSVLA